jgi:hypothetical protein
LAGFDSRGWLRELPAMDTFGALIFMVTGAAAVGTVRRAHPWPGP